MWIPFEVPAEGVKDHDVTGSEILGFVDFPEHFRDNAAYGMEEAVKEITVFEKEVTEIFINGKDTVPVFYIDELKRHVCSAFHGIFVTACRTEPAMAAERDELQLSAF